MEYAEYALIDRGYVDEKGNPLASIEGRDNQTEPFRHLGLAGYPAGRIMCFDAPGQHKTLAVFADGVSLPEGGTEIQATGVVVLLVADYGWPEGTQLVDGVPVAPERSL
jgi:hypothetical protein